MTWEELVTKLQTFISTIETRHRDEIEEQISIEKENHIISVNEFNNLCDSLTIDPF